MKIKKHPYLEIFKPGIVIMQLVTVSIGFLWGLGDRPMLWMVFFITLLGTGVVAAGSCMLNQYMERDADAKMDRTNQRPLPKGVFSPVSVLIVGAWLVFLGTFLLIMYVSLLTGFIALMTSYLYILVYTPLKRLTWLNTLVGAVPGALPPLGGWVAASGAIEWGGVVLFLILFAWQIPHFFALAWMYKEDYRKGGLVMLPVIDTDGRRTIRQILLYTALLFVFSILPYCIGVSGWIYLIGAVVLGAAFMVKSIGLARHRSVALARSVFRTSIIYLPLLLLLVLLDMGIGKLF